MPFLALLAPFAGCLEQLLKLLNTLLEGTPVGIRNATAIAWWKRWEPLVLLGLPPEAKVAVKEAVKDL